MNILSFKFFWILILFSLLTPLTAQETSLETKSERLKHFAKAQLHKSPFSNLPLELYRELYQVEPDNYFLLQQQLDLLLPGDPFATAKKEEATLLLRHFAEQNRNHLTSQLDYVEHLETFYSEDHIGKEAILETLTLANENFPHHLAVFPQLIRKYESLEDRENSLSLLEKQLQAPPEHSAHWATLLSLFQTLYPSDSLDGQKHTQQAIANLTEHGLSSPSTARKVSEYHRQQGNFPKAIEVIEKHLSLVPASNSLRVRLALLQLSLDDEESGEKNLLAALQVDHKTVLAHQSLAKLYLKKDLPLKALHHKAKLYHIRGGDAEEAVELAQQYLDAAQPNPARRLLERALFYEPDDPSLAARLGMTFLQEEQSKKALEFFRNAEQIAKESESDLFLNDPDFHYHFAQALQQEGEFPAAESRLRQAADGLNLDEEPSKYARAITDLAALWLEQDKNQGPARALLERAISLDPENEKAISLLQKN